MQRVQALCFSLANCVRVGESPLPSKVFSIAFRGSPPSNGNLIWFWKRTFLLGKPPSTSGNFQVLLALGEILWLAWVEASPRLVFFTCCFGYWTETSLEILHVQPKPDTSLEVLRALSIFHEPTFPAEPYLHSRRLLLEGRGNTSSIGRIMASEAFPTKPLQEFRGLPFFEGVVL